MRIGLEWHLSAIKQLAQSICNHCLGESDHLTISTSDGKNEDVESDEEVVRFCFIFTSLTLQVHSRFYYGTDSNEEMDEKIRKQLEKHGQIDQMVLLIGESVDIQKLHCYSSFVSLRRDSLFAPNSISNCSV